MVFNYSLLSLVCKFDGRFNDVTFVLLVFEVGKPTFGPLVTSNLGSGIVNIMGVIAVLGTQSW